MSCKLGPADREMAALATRQHGVVAQRQLAALGLGRDAVQHRLATGRLHLLHRGVYAVGHMRLTQHGHWMAAVVACGEGALLSHRSAAALWRLGAFPNIRTDVSVSNRSGRSRGQIAIHRPRALADEDRAEADGVPVTSPARTLLDLGSAVGPIALERAFDEADRRGLLDIRALSALCARASGRRGVIRLRALLAESRSPSPETRSVLEHRFLQLCRRAGLPRPAVNVPVGGYEVDALWPAARLVVELDGYAFHRARTAFESDRARDAALQLAGYRVLRVTHRRLVEEPGSVVETIRRLLAAAPRSARSS